MTGPTRFTRSPWPARSSRTTDAVDVPSEHYTLKQAAAQEKFAEYLDLATANL